MTGQREVRERRTFWDNQRKDAVLWAVLAGFLVSYLLFFVAPIFLNDSGRMAFPRYIPTLQKRGFIGEDAKSLRIVIAEWQKGMDPYSLAGPGSHEVIYPPLALLLLSPLAVVDDQTAYAMMVIVSLVAFIIMTLLLPVAIRQRLSGILVLVAATGIASYGMQFEVERGQFNTLAACLGMVAIYLFHFHGTRRLIRYLAYLLLSIGIQLKVFPALYLLALFSEWSDWRGNLRRLLGLGVLNLALLLSLGVNMFGDFVGALLEAVSGTSGAKTNHSIASFVTVAHDVNNSGWPFAASAVPSTTVAERAVAAQLLLLLLFVVVLGIFWWQNTRGKVRGFSPPILLWCALAALMLPSQSYDYTLPTLAPAMAIFLDWISGGAAFCGPDQRLGVTSIARLIIAALLAFAYASCLFSYTNKPDLLLFQSTLPALAAVFVLATILSLLHNDATPGPNLENASRDRRLGGVRHPR